MWEPVYLLDIIFNIGGEDSLGSLGNFGNFGNISRCNVWGQSIGMKQKNVASCNNLDNFGNVDESFI